MGEPKSIGIGLIFLFLLMTSLSWADMGGTPPPSDPLVRRYTIRVSRLSPRSVGFSAELTLQVTNQSLKPLDHLVFVLYPHRFSKELPGLDDVTYPRVYPYGFSQGDMILKNIRTADGMLLAAKPLKVPESPSGTFVDVKLPSPIPAGGTEQFSVAYTVVVPEKFGSFGRFNGLLTMNGGWYPYLASYRAGEYRVGDFPALSDFQLKLGIDGEAMVGEKFVAGWSDKKEINVSLPAHHQVSFFLADRLKREKLSDRLGSVEILRPAGVAAETASQRELVVQWFEFVNRQPELSRRLFDLHIVTSPIREAMIVKGDGLIYLSDRAFKVLPSLRQYHSMPILHALFYQLVVGETSGRETAEDYHWVADAIAWRWTTQFVNERSYESVDARTLKPVHFFSFLYAVDRLLYSPQFAFFDVFFNYVYPYDPVRDDLLTFNHHRPFGRTVYAHMEDFLGSGVADRIAKDYLASSPKTLKEISQADQAYSTWIRPWSSVNYKLEPPKRRAKTEKGVSYDVTIKKEAETPVEEPVELLVQSRKGESKLLQWDGKGTEKTFQVELPDPLKVAEIDPRHRLMETRLADNRDPPYYKMVLTDYTVNVDFNENRPTGYLAGEFRRSYGGFNRYHFATAYSIDSYGIAVGYTRLFGRIVDRLRLTHGVSLGYSFNRMSEDSLAFLDPATNTKKIVRIADAQFDSALSASYSFGDQISFTNPLRGGGAWVSATWGNPYLGGESNYYQTSLGSSWILPFHPNHFVAVQGMLGLSGPSDIPSRVQYRLAGLGAMRGLSFSDDRFAGRNILLTSAEYRHILIRDMDLNFWLFRLRYIQGAIFADAGRVTDTVVEGAERAAFGSTHRSSFGNLFDVRDFSTDVGYGLRFHVDYLGVNPGLLRFDAAKSLSESGENIRFYFAVTQSF